MNIKINEFNVVKLQSVFFTKNIKIGNKLDFAQQVTAATDNIFDGDPMILPIPETQENGPTGIPIMILKSSDNQFNCNISKNRIDFFFSKKKEYEKSIIELWPDYLKIIKDFSIFIKDRLNEKVWRLGFVATLIKDIGKSVNLLLNEKYLNTNIFEEPYEIQLNVLKKISLKDIKVNRWIKYRPLRKKDDISKDYWLSIEIDMNTFPEIIHDLNKEQINKFFESAYDNITSKIPEYILL